MILTCQYQDSTCRLVFGPKHCGSRLHNDDANCMRLLKMRYEADGRHSTVVALVVVVDRRRRSKRRLEPRRRCRRVAIGGRRV